MEKIDQVSFDFFIWLIFIFLEWFWGVFGLLSGFLGLYYVMKILLGKNKQKIEFKGLQNMDSWFSNH